MTRGLFFFCALTFVGCERNPAEPQPPPGEKQGSLPIAERGEKQSQDAATQRAGNAPPPPLRDKGVFADLDGDVVLRCPSWLDRASRLHVTDPKSKRSWWAFDGVIVCEAEPKRETIKLNGASQDHDGDQIPDAVDLLRGAKKAALNQAQYKNSYQELSYPGGDVPRTEGVCTDVVIRTARNTGRDLQKLIADDIKSRPSAYPMVKKADPYIDHRRVRTLLPYFEKHTEELPVDHEDTAFAYLPGDIVFMNTMGDEAPEHMGVVSDQLGPSGSPLIINNWTQGTVTKEMDLLGSFAVTHRFRLVGKLRVEKDHLGLAGILARHGLKVPGDTSQVLLVTTPSWNSSGGTLTRWERRPSGRFGPSGDEQATRVGRQGLGTGLGLHETITLAPTPKKEGDKKAPAGVFRLGTAFGRRSAAPYSGTWPYRALTSLDHWIDDPKSPDYNRWVTLKPGETLQVSSEHLIMYSLGLVVEHNAKRPQPGAGSAIFIHPWKTPETATVGCTALPEAELKDILSWLDPEKKPVLVQVAGRLL